MKTTNVVKELSQQIDNDHGALYQYCYKLDEKLTQLLLHRSIPVGPQQSVDVMHPPQPVQLFYIYVLPVLTCIGIIGVIKIISRPTFATYVKDIEHWFDQFAEDSLNLKSALI